MSNFFFYLLLLFMLLFSGQETVVTPPTATPHTAPAENIGVPLGAPFALKWGHPGAVGGTDIVVNFDRIVSDPRCPQGTKCDIDFPVAVAFTVYGSRGAPAHIVLTAHTDGEGAVLPAAEDVVVADTAHGFTFTLLKVTPYPKAGDVTRPGNYQAWLRVDPAAEAAPPTHTAPGTPFTLAPGDTIELDDTGEQDDTGMMVGVLSVADSRCPIDLDCGAGGKNGVEVGVLVLDQYGQTEQIKLTGRTGYDGLLLPPTGEMQPQVTVGDYTLKLLQVTPFPQSSDAIASDGYKVTLIVVGPGDAPAPPATPAPPAGGEIALGVPFDLRLHAEATVVDPAIEAPQHPPLDTPHGSRDNGQDCYDNPAGREQAAKARSIGHASGSNHTAYTTIVCAPTGFGGTGAS